MIFNEYLNKIPPESVGVTNTADIYFSNIETSTYTMESAYNEYINSKINNEQEILSMLGSKLNLKESVILEATAGDRIKARFNKVIEFVKSMAAKFMEALTAFFQDNKTYLEKYKDIILNKKPKSDIKISCLNYNTAINRLQNTQAQLFVYGDYINYAEDDSPKGMAEKIMEKAGASGFTFDDTEDTATNFKNYFTASDQDMLNGNLDTIGLNFKQMYDFCYSWENIKKVVERDQKLLSQAVNQINTAIADAQKTTTDNTQENAPKQESYIMEDENDVGNKPTDTTTNQTVNTTKDTTPRTNDATKNMKNRALNIDSNKAKELGNQTIAANNDANNGGNKDSLDKLQKCVDRYSSITQNLITAKMTACESIQKEMMEIIRNHVRSYGGKDLKNAEDNRKSTHAGYVDKDKQEQQNTE